MPPATLTSILRCRAYLWNSLARSPISTPSIRPRPRTSVISRCSSAILFSCPFHSPPSSADLSTSPSAFMVLITALAAAQARGLPPKVVPWVPGVKVRASSGEATMAPMGTPPPRALAREIMSGTTPKCWKPNHLPVLPNPVCTSSTISSAPCSEHRSLAVRKYSRSAGMTPPSPCTGSSMTAAVPRSTWDFSPSMSLKPTNSTFRESRGSKPL